MSFICTKLLLLNNTWKLSLLLLNHDKGKMIEDMIIISHQFQTFTTVCSFSWTALSFGQLYLLIKLLHEHEHDLRGTTIYTNIHAKCVYVAALLSSLSYLNKLSRCASNYKCLANLIVKMNWVTLSYYPHTITMIWKQWLLISKCHCSVGCLLQEYKNTAAVTQRITSIDDCNGRSTQSIQNK